MPKNTKLFFIAEIGLNHNGQLDLAKRMIDSAKTAGVDAVKFQSITASKLVSMQSMQQSVSGFGFTDVATSGEFWKKVSIDRMFHEKISQHCKNAGIEFMSTPFDPESADLLYSLKVARYKIASGDITHYPLLGHIARKGKPVILSTGASSLVEIDAAVQLMRENGNNDITLLHCISIYPAPSRLANLNAIPLLMSLFDTTIGFSDHTLGIHIPLAAIAKGAVVVEKHFTLDRNLPGPDQSISAVPEEFRNLVQFGREVFEALQDQGKRVSEEEHSMRTVMRRSIVAARNLPKGKVLEENDLDFKRPESGISPIFYKHFLGKRLRKNMNGDELMGWGSVEGE